MNVKLRNERSGGLMEIKVGWSWALFLFSGFLGIPLFLRKLNMWGAMMLTICILSWVLNVISHSSDRMLQADILLLIVNIAQLSLMIFFGIKGNELTAKNLLENGWVFSDKDDQATTYARTVWALA